MNAAQEKHLADIKKRMCERIDRKYRDGQAEHGGDMWLKPCMEDLLDEIADSVVYAETLKSRAQRIFNIQKGEL
jgi:hypothetical protein